MKRWTRPRFRRYEWSAARRLLELDVKAAGALPHAWGHRVAATTNGGVAYDPPLRHVDDNSRLAYVEPHPREDA